MILSDARLLDKFDLDEPLFLPLIGTGMVDDNDDDSDEEFETPPMNQTADEL